MKVMHHRHTLSASGASDQRRCFCLLSAFVSLTSQGSTATEMDSSFSACSGSSFSSTGVESPFKQAASGSGFTELDASAVTESKLAFASTTQTILQLEYLDLLTPKWILIVHSTQLSTVGNRAFPVSTACIWNELPCLVTSAPFLQVFCCRLKTYLFSNSFLNLLQWIFSDLQHYRTFRPPTQKNKN